VQRLIAQPCLLSELHHGGRPDTLSGSVSSSRLWFPSVAREPVIPQLTSDSRFWRKCTPHTVAVVRTTELARKTLDARDMATASAQTGAGVFRAIGGSDVGCRLRL
jgi:hypothetical protein